MRNKFVSTQEAHNTCELFFFNFSLLFPFSLLCFYLSLYCIPPMLCWARSRFRWSTRMNIRLTYLSLAVCLAVSLSVNCGTLLYALYFIGSCSNNQQTMRREGEFGEGEIREWGWEGILGLSLTYKIFRFPAPPAVALCNHITTYKKSCNTFPKFFPQKEFFGGVFSICH